MKAHYLNNEKDIRIIRPLVRVRENQTRDFSESAGLPIIPDNCPACYAKPQERQRMKALLLEQENTINTCTPIFGTPCNHWWRTTTMPGWRS